LKKSDEYSYIVRFPPNRKVENLVIGKASVFDLNRPGVVGSLSVWNGEIEPIGSLTEVWVLIQEIPPKWVDWRTMCEVSSGLGRMIEVDWQALLGDASRGFRPSHCTNSGSTTTKPSVLSWEMPLYAARLHASLGLLHCEARLAELPS